MGFLDGSTNNIIIDAVLTDLGRATLSRNDGTFSIARYSFGDDEVDYGIIKKFGRTVGKEKIIKNTPVLDANTNSAIALSNKLITQSDQGLSRLPIIELTAAQGVLNTSGNIPVLSVTKNKNARFTLQQTIVNEDRIPTGLIDTAFIVQADDRFVAINNRSPNFVNANNAAVYRIVRGNTGVSAQGGALITFNVRAKAITDSQFTTFGNVSNKTVITTFLKIQGVQSGATQTVEVQISKT